MGPACSAVSFLVVVTLPMSFFFVLLTRANFSVKGGSFDAEWQDVGLEASRYRRFPSGTPTEARLSNPGDLSWRQLLRRGVVDPALELETWEALALCALLVLTLALFKGLRWACSESPRSRNQPSHKKHV